MQDSEEEIGTLIMAIMEGYKDTVKPSFPDHLPSSETGPRLSRTSHITGVSCTKSPFAEMVIREKGGSSSRKRARNDVNGETQSKQKEHERREKMNDMFHQLQSLVPSLKGINKLTREKIVEDAINYIKFLEGERERLEGAKKSMLHESAKSALSHCTNMNSSVNVTAASNGVVFFGIQLPAKTSLVTKIFRVFHKHQAEVLTASVSVNGQGLLMLAATVVLGNNGGEMIIEKIKREILIQ